jgi:hypothetical protein
MTRTLLKTRLTILAKETVQVLSVPGLGASIGFAAVQCKAVFFSLYSLLLNNFSINLF